MTQQPADSHRLVGEWWGTWQLKSTPQYQGQYYLTIEKVEGNKVQGRGWASNPRVSEWRFQGTLDGNRLTWGHSTKTELTIYGDRMEGDVHSTIFPPHTVRLLKRK